MKPPSLPHRAPASSTSRQAAAWGLASAAALALALGCTTTAQADVTPASETPVITAAPEAKLTFARPTVTTVAAPTPDDKLRIVLASTGTAPDPAKIKASLAAPMAVLTHTSPFGGRTSPIHGAAEFHRGQDFAGQCGTDVFASAGGKVVFAGWHPHGGGNRVEIEHADGLRTTYNHLESFSVRGGQEVSRGEIIAGVGTTGSSTGCHLHFEVEHHGEVVDPMNWL